MPKPSNRDKILTEGLKVVHQRGFGGASVRDIIQAAGVPQGSFTNHFQSKEAFGLEIIDLYFDHARQTLDATLRNDGYSPLRRLRDYIDANQTRLHDDGMENGCLFGNFLGEAVDHSEAIRLRLLEIFAEVTASLEYCLNAAIAAGELPAHIDSAGVAGYIVGGLHGAMLMAKVERSGVPVERFEQILFGMILARPDILLPALSLDLAPATAAA
ncbi:TetR/AcrR family transcriptional regulator [Rugamonas sp.]|uniref:TetR/AcrR family transcriptional regulator n=1 Tax=Rugamonas sp. TaxID=1926287 RepID=UPI0025ED520B|nr:TetR/AcrR family transcriptional regulator [Rugamonas sp.]